MYPANRTALGFLKKNFGLIGSLLAALACLATPPVSDAVSQPCGRGNSKKPCSPTVTLTSQPTSIVLGNTSLLSWTSKYATTLNIQPGIGSVGTQGSVAVSPQQTTTYTLTATGSGGTTTASATVTVTPPPAPTATLSASPTTVTQGQSSTLTWSSQNATTLDLQPGIGSVSAQGSLSVAPSQTTTYTLTATGSGGTTSASATVTVNPLGVQLTPTSDIQAAVNANPNGTTFVLAPGIYRGQSIVPKTGNVFIGETGAVLNGAILVTSWTQASSVWVAQVPGLTQAATYRGVCQPAYPACMYPEDLFFDSQVLRRVATLASVVAGTWHLDYSTQKAYVGSNPSGRVTEISMLRSAFRGTASSVTIRNLVVEKYASIAGYGAINAISDSGSASLSWIVDSNEIRFNHGMGLRISNSMQVKTNKIHDNGQMGLGGSGNNVLIENNEIYGNNYAGYQWAWEGGGDKFTYSKNLTIRGNYAHDNMGPGLWTDINNDYVLIENNHTARNKMAGIMHEISFHATIRNNQVEDDGFTPAGTSIWYGNGILVSNSSDVEVYGNIVTNCVNGIAGIQADRGLAPDGTPYTLKNLNVHDNTITQQVNYAAGIVKGATFDDSVYTSWGNHFQNNTFNLSDPNGKYFYWLGQPWTYDQWVTYTSLH